MVVEVVREKGFHLDVEDYLAGVLIMASELVSRVLIAFALNQQCIKPRAMFFSFYALGNVEL